MPLHPFHKVDQIIRGATCICDAVFLSTLIPIGDFPFNLVQQYNITSQSAMESGILLIYVDMFDMIDIDVILLSTFNQNQNVLICLQHLAISVLHLLEPRIATMTMSMVALSSLHLFPTAAAASVTLNPR